MHGSELKQTFHRFSAFIVKGQVTSHFLSEALFCTVHERCLSNAVKRSISAASFDLGFSELTYASVETRYDTFTMISFPPYLVYLYCGVLSASNRSKRSEPRTRNAWIFIGLTNKREAHHLHYTTK
jgi:hypothetical protein